MAFFRRLEDRLVGLTTLFRPNQSWLIVINADPDSLGCALALRRIMGQWGTHADIAHTNVISRPDNLAMIRYLRIPLVRLNPEVASGYQRFAMVDSQPHHCPDFLGLPYEIILDHHPLSPAHPLRASYAEVRPEYGAASTLLTEYLYNLGIKPGKLLATALLYGIKSDTQSFERDFSDVDLKAFSYLSKHASKPLLRKILHSDFHRKWLPYFTLAFSRIRYVGREGLMAYLGAVDSPDILVILADFFLRVHGLSWDCIAGLWSDKLIAVMRSDGLRRNMGKRAHTWFGSLGSAGGHAMAARAEIPVSALRGQNPEEFLWRRMSGRAQDKAKALADFSSRLPVPIFEI